MPLMKQGPNMEKKRNVVFIYLFMVYLQNGSTYLIWICCSIRKCEFCLYVVIYFRVTARYSKAAGDFLIAEQKTEKNYDYFNDLHRRFLLKRCAQPPKTKRPKRMLSVDNPKRIRQNIAPITRPPTKELIKRPRISMDMAEVESEVIVTIPSSVEESTSVYDQNFIASHIH